MPFGVKADLDGRTLDFDYLYREVIKPAVEQVGIECRRLDEFASGAIWHKTLLTALISSDLVIADLSTHNANVLYELGVRHAMKRGRTVLISARGRLPGNVSYAQALWYEPDEGGRLSGEPAAKFRDTLQSAIRQSQRTTISDSPIYEFFPDLQVILPPELEPPYRASRVAKQRGGFAQSVVESPAKAMDNLRQSEKEIRSAPGADPIEYLTLLRKYRDLSEWDRVISLADDAPPAIATSPEVQQLLALALNRRGATGDQDRAIKLMEQLVAETGGDGETFGILGLIYKQRYEQAKSRSSTAEAIENLQRSLQYYRQGFEKNPKDYYLGINIVTLLLQRNDDAGQAEINAFVPRVRAALQEKGETSPLDFWEISVTLQLAAVTGDWAAAEQAARLAASQRPSAWVLDTTQRQLRLFGENLTHAGDRSRFEQIVRVLRQPETIPGSVG
jgi:tetratricopeptide (TPR) repeat protein